MNSAMSHMYCVPWGGPTLREQIAINKRAKVRKKLKPSERICRMLERGRRPTIKQVAHELSLELNAVLQIIIDDSRLDVRTREFRTTDAGNKIHIQEVIPAEGTP